MLILSFFLFFGGGQTPTLQETNAGLQTVYDAIVGDDGNVDYRTLNHTMNLSSSLQRVTDFGAVFDPQKVDDKNQKIAILANLYNAYTLLGVQRAWPVKSVRDIRPFFGFFTRDEWPFNGRNVSLNHIEKKHLQELDPRIHFLINCASKSCPNLIDRVFTANNVEAHMDEAAKRFLLDEQKNRFDRDADEWFLSKIFKWYEADFGGRDGVISFIQKYRPDLADWTPGKIKYLTYDWSLNGPTN